MSSRVAWPHAPLTHCCPCTHRLLHCRRWFGSAASCDSQPFLKLPSQSPVPGRHLLRPLPSAHRTTGSGLVHAFPPAVEMSRDGESFASWLDSTWIRQQK